MQPFSQSWFRGLIGGLILADMIGQFRAGEAAMGETQESLPWPTLWTGLAQTLIAGDFADLNRWQQPIEQLAAAAGAEAEVAVAIATLPLRLIPHPPQFSPSIETTATATALWRVLAGSSHPRPQEFPTPLGQAAATAVWNCGGQFSLAIEHLLGQQRRGLIFSLAALLSRSAPTALPLIWRCRWLQETSGLHRRWHLRSEIEMWQLADSLHSRWAGVCSSRAEVASDLRVVAPYRQHYPDGKTII